jgi:hypothetical protein
MIAPACQQARGRELGPATPRPDSKQYLDEELHPHAEPEMEHESDQEAANTKPKAFELSPRCRSAPIELVDHDPNQVVSASRNPSSVPSPTQATWPSGLTRTADGADTSPITGSSQVPACDASIS